MDGFLLFLLIFGGAAIINNWGSITKAMAGWPMAQVRRPDGLAMTLYRGAEHPFIHALNTAEAWAVCIDLPGAHAHDAKAALDWGLAPAPDGGAVFAVNATLGLVEDISPSDLLVRKHIARHWLLAGNDCHRAGRLLCR